jgi:hypothetical protein
VKALRAAEHAHLADLRRGRKIAAILKAGFGSSEVLISLGGTADGHRSAATHHTRATQIPVPVVQS